MLSITSVFSLHENTTYEAMIFQNISFNILFKVLKEKQCSHKLSPKECRKSLLLHNATLSEESYHSSLYMYKEIHNTTPRMDLVLPIQSFTSIPYPHILRWEYELQWGKKSLCKVVNYKYCIYCLKISILQLSKRLIFLLSLHLGRISDGNFSLPKLGKVMPLSF